MNNQTKRKYSFTIGVEHVPLMLLGLREEQQVNHGSVRKRERGPNKDNR